MQQARRFLNRYASSQAIKEVMKKFDDIVPSAEVIMLVSMVGFMWIAMKPIL